MDCKSANSWGKRIVGRFRMSRPMAITPPSQSRPNRKATKNPPKRVIEIIDENGSEAQI
jgi:hypothetical protein